MYVRLPPVSVLPLQHLLTNVHAVCIFSIVIAVLSVGHLVTDTALSGCTVVNCTIISTLLL